MNRAGYLISDALSSPVHGAHLALCLGCTWPRARDDQEQSYSVAAEQEVLFNESIMAAAG